MTFSEFEMTWLGRSVVGAGRAFFDCTPWAHVIHMLCQPPKRVRYHCATPCKKPSKSVRFEWLGITIRFEARLVFPLRDSTPADHETGNGRLRERHLDRTESRLAASFERNIIAFDHDGRSRSRTSVRIRRGHARSSNLTVSPIHQSGGANGHNIANSSTSGLSEFGGTPPGMKKFKLPVFINGRGPMFQINPAC